MLNLSTTVHCFLLFSPISLLNLMGYSWSRTYNPFLVNFLCITSFSISPSTNPLSLRLSVMHASIIALIGSKQSQESICKKKIKILSKPVLQNYNFLVWRRDLINCPLTKFSQTSMTFKKQTNKRKEKEQLLWKSSRFLIKE